MGEREQPKSKRHWIVDVIDEETGEVDRGAVMEALGDAEAVAFRMGHAVQVTPLRQIVRFDDGSERAYTRGVRFDVFGIPAARVDAAELGGEEALAEFGGGAVVEPVGGPEGADLPTDLPFEDIAKAHPAAEPDIPVDPEPVVDE